MRLLDTCALLSILISGAGCNENPATGEREIVLVSNQQEIAMGREAAPEFEREFGGRLNNSQVQNYVQQVGSRVAGAAPRQMPYEFVVLNSTDVNAFALPGGKIYVTRGLMRAMTSEAQLAGVLGHEVAHVAARHSVQRIQQQMGVDLLARLAGYAIGGDAQQIAETATKVAGAMVTLRYSREDEYEADQLGMNYMSQAGYNPNGMVQMLTQLESISGGGGALEFFSTHPNPGDRVERARDYARQRFPQAPASPPADGQYQRIRQML